MAKSRFEYVKQFEQTDTLLPDTYIVVRVDGKNFHAFSKHYDFAKPNDERALRLMNASAKNVVLKHRADVIAAYGESDEYSFILRRDSELYKRRSAKLSTLFVSLFTANYVALWPKFFQERPLDLAKLPHFDARCVMYPNITVVKDYLAWRYVDTHINNLYNTAFWQLQLVCGMSAREAEARLSGTLSSEKNEILFKDCGINYNNEPEMYKKGTLITRRGEVLHVNVIDTLDEIFQGFE